MFTYVGPFWLQSKHCLFPLNETSSRRIFKFLSSCFLRTTAIIYRLFVFFYLALNFLLKTQTHRAIFMQISFFLFRLVIQLLTFWVFFFWFCFLFSISYFYRKVYDVWRFFCLWCYLLFCWILTVTHNDNIWNCFLFSIITIWTLCFWCFCVWVGKKLNDWSIVTPSILIIITINWKFSIFYFFTVFLLLLQKKGRSICKQ